MTRLPLTGLLICLAACAKPPSAPPPVVPDALLQPVPRPAREVRTLRDAGLLIVDYDAALAQANTQIGSIRGLVRPAE